MINTELWQRQLLQVMQIRVSEHMQAESNAIRDMMRQRSVEAIYIGAPSQMADTQEILVFGLIPSHFDA